MRIGCLQFAPQVGDVDQNLNRADAVLNKAKPRDLEDLDLLVLPELAFTGYNFNSLKHISPHLENTAAGISQLWARTAALRHNCAVVVGYPEKVDLTPKWPCSPEYYNASVTVNRDGETVAHYRKTFLYPRDERWALEGPAGFYGGYIDGLGNIAMGISSDLNPYRTWESPWSAWEFSHHVLHVRADLVVISMAWSTAEDLRSYSREPHKPDMHILAHWVARLEPLIRREDEGEIIVVIVNRTGVEGDVVYAGTSCVLGIHDGEVKLYGVLGRGERELLTVDTDNGPMAKLIHDMTENTSESLRNYNSDSNGSKSTQDSQESDNTDPDYHNHQLSIDEILHSKTPISPVEAKAAHPFFNSHPEMDERQEVRSSIIHEDEESFNVGWEVYVDILRSSKGDGYQTLKSAANGTNHRDTSAPITSPPRRDTATPDSSYERPCSPKSRNASRDRHFNRQSLSRQSPALREHDLADNTLNVYEDTPAHTDRSVLGSNSAQGRRKSITRINPPILYSQWDFDSDVSDNEIVEIMDLKEGTTETIIPVKESELKEKNLPPLPVIQPSPIESVVEQWVDELPSHTRRRAERLLPYSRGSDLGIGPGERPKSTGW